jgi:hypothetical protein
MDRFILIGDHMVDTDNIKTARIDRVSYQLITIDSLGKPSGRYAFENLEELVDGLVEFVKFMNQKDKVSKVKQTLSNKL